MKYLLAVLWDIGTTWVYLAFVSYLILKYQGFLGVLISGGKSAEWWHLSTLFLIFAVYVLISFLFVLFGMIPWKVIEKQGG